MSRQDVAIPSAEGDIRACIFAPDRGEPPWPTAIMFMDGRGYRPPLFSMAQRLADHGYCVLLPDMFWRLAPYEGLGPQASEVARKAFFAKYLGSTGPEKTGRDTKACLDWLATQRQAKADRIGVFGYCMGGGMSLRAAAAFPDRVVAVGSFHGGNLATDKPDSPHTLAARIRAKVLVAGADQDPGFDAAQKARLEQAFDAGGVDGEVTIYEGALHGYAVPDSPVYNAEAAARHWRELVSLFDRELK